MNRGTLVAVLTVLAVLGTAAAAQACSYRLHADASGPRTPGQRSALVIGDSTMVYAAPHLGRLGLETDAKECRQFGQGVALVRARRARGGLPHLVVVALGANGAVAVPALERLLRAVGRGRVLAVVTPPNSASTGRAMRTFARRHPDRVLLMDWAAFSARRPAVYGPDRIHPTPDGARVYASFIADRAAPVVRPPARRLRLPPRTTGTKDCGTRVRFGRRLRVRVVYGRDRIDCARARALAARPPLRPIPGWRWADWTPLPGPWLDVLRRRDGRVVIATVPAPRD